MFMLQDQTLLQGDRHGSPILGTFTACKSNTIQPAAYLEMDIKFIIPSSCITFCQGTHQYFLLERHKCCVGLMSKVVIFEKAELCCMSCREITDVENTFYLSISYSRGSVTCQHFQALCTQMKKLECISNKIGENTYAQRKSAELCRDAQINKYLSSLPKDINILIFPCMYILSQKS